MARTATDTADDNVSYSATSLSRGTVLSNSPR
jgi:hypothetical protein